MRNQECRFCGDIFEPHREDPENTTCGDCEDGERPEMDDDFSTCPSFKDSFKLYPEYVRVMTAKAYRLSTEGVKADMIAIGKGAK